MMPGCIEKAIHQPTTYLAERKNVSQITLFRLESNTNELITVG